MSIPARRTVIHIFCKGYGQTQLSCFNKLIDCFHISVFTCLSLTVKRIKVAITVNLSVFVKLLQLVDRENIKVDGKDLFHLLQDMSQEYHNNFFMYVLMCEVPGNVSPQKLEFLSGTNCLTVKNN